MVLSILIFPRVFFVHSQISAKMMSVTVGCKFNSFRFGATSGGVGSKQACRGGVAVLVFEKSPVMGADIAVVSLWDMDEERRHYNK